MIDEKIRQKLVLALDVEDINEAKDIDATVTQALEVGKALSDGDSTYDYYKITGYVTDFDGTNFVNESSLFCLLPLPELLLLPPQYFS